jgi:hypothetical protein
MKITFPTKEDVKWDLTLSHEIDQPWTGFDAFPFSPFPPFPPFDIFIPPFAAFDPCNDAFQTIGCQYETFSGSNQEGWNNGQLNWSSQPAAAIENNEGVLYTSPPSTLVVGPSASIAALPPLEITWDMHWNSLPPDLSPVSLGGFIANSENGSYLDGPMFLLYLGGGGGVASQIRNNQGTFSSFTTGLTGYIPDRVISCRWRITADTLYFKAWYKASPEPSDWTHTTATTAPITFKIMAYGQNTFDEPGPDVFFDNISVCAGQMADIPDDCADDIPPPSDLPVGATCENLTRIDTPPDSGPGSPTYFQASNVYEPGTTKVWVDGLRLAWYDYDELPDQGMIAVHADVDVGGLSAFDPPKGVYACYLGGAGFIAFQAGG